MREWWARRRKGRLTRDVCATCGRPLREKERIEVADDIAFSPEFGGMSAMLVAYCPKDAP